MSGRKIKKDNTRVVRRKVIPVKKIKKTKKKSTIKKYPKGKMLASSGSIGLITGGTGKLLKLAANVIKKVVAKKVLKKKKK